MIVRECNNVQFIPSINIIFSEKQHEVPTMEPQNTIFLQRCLIKKIEVT